MRTKREARALQEQIKTAAPTAPKDSMNRESDALQHPVKETAPNPEVRIEQITNWRAFGYPQVQQALYHWKPYTEQEAWGELVIKVTEGKAAVWAAGIPGSDDIVGLGIILLPENALWPLPYIAHVHTTDQAPSGTRRALLDAGIAFLKSKGYTRCWAINAAGISDEAWVRSFRRGGRINKLGTVFQITLW